MHHNDIVFFAFFVEDQYHFIQMICFVDDHSWLIRYNFADLKQRFFVLGNDAVVNQIDQIRWFFFDPVMVVIQIKQRAFSVAFNSDDVFLFRILKMGNVEPIDIEKINVCYWISISFLIFIQRIIEVACGFV